MMTTAVDSRTRSRMFTAPYMDTAQPCPPGGSTEVTVALWPDEAEPEPPCDPVDPDVGAWDPSVDVVVD